MVETEQELDELADVVSSQSQLKKKPDDNVIDADFQKVSSPLDTVTNIVRRVADVSGATAGAAVDTAIDTKATLSETKLKIAASHYGIGSEKFEQLKQAGKLQDVYRAISDGKEHELAQKKTESQAAKLDADTRNTESIASKREMETYLASVPDGGNKLIAFGSTGFGKNKLYLNNGNASHSRIREKYTPNQASGVTRSLDSSRAQIEILRQNVVKRPTVAAQTYPGVSASSPAIRTSPIGGGVSIRPPSAVPSSVLSLQPNGGQSFTTGRGIPSPVLRLGAMGTGAPVLQRLSPNGRESSEDSVLSRLNPRRFKL